MGREAGDSETYGRVMRKQGYKLDEELAACTDADGV